MESYHSRNNIIFVSLLFTWHVSQSVFTLQSKSVFDWPTVRYAPLHNENIFSLSLPCLFFVGVFCIGTHAEPTQLPHSNEWLGYVYSHSAAFCLNSLTVDPHQ